MHSYIDTILEIYICCILTAEYFYGRSDADLKREEKRKKSRKPVFTGEDLTQGEMK